MRRGHWQPTAAVSWSPLPSLCQLLLLGLFYLTRGRRRRWNQSHGTYTSSFFFSQMRRFIPLLHISCYSLPLSMLLRNSLHFLLKFQVQIWIHLLDQVLLTAFCRLHEHFPCLLIPLYLLLEHLCFITPVSPFSWSVVVSLPSCCTALSRCARPPLRRSRSTPHRIASPLTWVLFSSSSLAPLGPGSQVFPSVAQISSS